jgi:hypothetical protein
MMEEYPIVEIVNQSFVCWFPVQTNWMLKNNPRGLSNATKP